jgi:hypothetical protein
VGDAVRRRDLTALAFVDRAISFLRRGHTAGERQLAIRLATAADSELQELLSRLPAPDPLPPPIRPVITGLIVFGSGSRETGDGRREPRDGRRETGAERRETGDGRRELRGGSRETGAESREPALGGGRRET